MAREGPVDARALIVFFLVCNGGKTMSTAGLRKCCHCGVWFKPHARNAFHQRYCCKPECRVASKRSSQQKWCGKNHDYFHGEVHVKRVQDCRRKHPGYWKGSGTAEDCGPPEALQDDIARVLTTCYERGQRIGGMMPWMQPQEVKHERTRADYAATAATHTPAV